jgi:DegV family protein with EDD domain
MVLCKYAAVGEFLGATDGRRQTGREASIREINVTITRLVVDSTCAMPERLFEKYQIPVLPLQVIIDNKSYRDIYEIQADQLYEAIRRGAVPKTSQINIAETEELFRSICEAGDDLIFLAFSSGMSGTYQVAQMVVRELRDEFPKTKLAVVDSEGGGASSGLIALQTARWIAEGRRYEDILSSMKELVSQVQHLFTVDSLTWLAKGGRLSRPVGHIGDILHIKPILNIVGKTMNVMRIVRGKKAAIRAVVHSFCEKAKDFPSQLVGIQHADDLATATTVEAMVCEARPEAKTVILPLCSVMASHIGIGGVGLFFFEKPVAGYDLLCETGIA